MFPEPAVTVFWLSLPIFGPPPPPLFFRKTLGDALERGLIRPFPDANSTQPVILPVPAPAPSPRHPEPVHLVQLCLEQYLFTVAAMTLVTRVKNCGKCSVRACWRTRHPPFHRPPPLSYPIFVHDDSTLPAILCVPDEKVPDVRRDTFQSHSSIWCVSSSRLSYGVSVAAPPLPVVYTLPLYPPVLLLLLPRLLRLLLVLPREPPRHVERSVRLPSQISPHRTSPPPPRATLNPPHWAPLSPPSVACSPR